MDAAVPQHIDCSEPYVLCHRPASPNVKLVERLCSDPFRRPAAFFEAFLSPPFGVVVVVVGVLGSMPGRYRVRVCAVIDHDESRLHVVDAGNLRAALRRYEGRVGRNGSNISFRSGRDE